MIDIDFRKMLSLYGTWNISTNGGTAIYTADAQDASHGLVLLANALDDGIIQCTIQLPEPSANCGAFIIFRANGQSEYYGAGLGGWDSAYTLFEGHNLQPTRLISAGNISNLVAHRDYRLTIALDGQRLQVSVDSVKVIDYDRLTTSRGAGVATSTGSGVGMFVFRGSREAIFGPMAVDDRRPNAFIAMQFTEPYNEVYRDAIAPLVEAIGYDPVRADDINRPGIILNDIWLQLTQASVVIAEVSEANPNVYYEIGVAHALGKPTVLLAQRGTKLPFDLGPHRCIFYDNTIPGRAKLLNSLKASLGTVLGVPPKSNSI